VVCVVFVDADVGKTVRIQHVVHGEPLVFANLKEEFTAGFEHHHSMIQQGAIDVETIRAAIQRGTRFVVTDVRRKLVNNC